MRVGDFEEFMQHCRPIRKIGLDRTLIQINETKEFIVMKTVAIGPNEPKTLLATLSEQKQLLHQHLLTIIDYCQTSKEEIEVLMEYCTHTLLEECQARIKLRNKFSLEELENIVLSVAKAMKYLQQKSVGHGCLSLRDISISENGIIKLVDPSMASNSPFTLLSGYYYSPQLLSFNINRKAIIAHKQEIKPFSTPQIHYFEAEQSFSEYFSANNTSHNLPNPIDDGNKEDSELFSEEQCHIDFFKNDIFCLGLLILELGLLIKENNFLKKSITLEEGVVHFDELQECLNEFQAIYGASFTSLLSRMLQQQPNSRATVEEILQIVEGQFQADLQQSQDNAERDQQRSSFGISSYYYDYEESDLEYSNFNNKTVKSFVLLSRADPNDISQAQPAEEQGDGLRNPEKASKNYFQQVYQARSLVASFKSSRQSMLLQNPVSLIPKIKNRHLFEGNQNVQNNFSVEESIEDEEQIMEKKAIKCLLSRRESYWEKRSIANKKVPLVKI